VAKFSNAQFTPPARHDKTVLSLSCQAVCIDRWTVLRRSASSGRTAPPDALRQLSGRLSSQRYARHDTTVLSVLCLVWRCELDTCYQRVQTSDFSSATVLSCREYNSHRRSGRGTDKTVLSRLAWQCELAFSQKFRTNLLKVGWWRSTVVERRSLTGELPLSCARPASDG